MKKAILKTEFQEELHLSLLYHLVSQDCLTCSVFSKMTTLLQSLALHLSFMVRIYKDHLILEIKKQESIVLLLLLSEAQTHHFLYVSLPPL